MPRDSLSPELVVEYAISVELANMVISLTKVVRIGLCTSRSITCVIPKCGEPHGLQGGVIIYFMNPWVNELLLQMFRGGGLTFCVYSDHIYHVKFLLDNA